MTRKFVTVGTGMAFSLALVGFAIFALGGTSSASTPVATASTATPAAAPVGREAWLTVSSTPGFASWAAFPVFAFTADRAARRA